MPATAALPSVPVVTACKHCQQVRRLRRRGLCRLCFYTPAVRAAYPQLKPQAPEVNARNDRQRRRGGRRCPHAPGSPEKVAFLARRYERGEPLHQPHDCDGPCQDDGDAWAKATHGESKGHIGRMAVARNDGGQDSVICTQVASKLEPISEAAEWSNFLAGDVAHWDRYRLPKAA